MIINIHKLLGRISFLQCKRWTITDVAKASGIPRSTLVKIESGRDHNISTRTLEKLITFGFFEIRSVLADRDRLSDRALRQIIIGELVASGPTYLATKRQVNEENRSAVESFLNFDSPEGDDVEL